MTQKPGTAIVKLAVCLFAVLGLSLAVVNAQDALSPEEIKELRRLLSKQSKENRLKGHGHGHDAGGDLAEPLSIGGYADIHANFQQDSADTGQVDLHRLVFMVNYEFSPNIKLMSETEIEHAYVSSGSGGEIVVEQFYLDFAVTERTSIHAGRVLAPLGIINAHHEPTTFNGVERPLVDTVLIPSTWSIDGIGIASQCTDRFSSSLYIGGGLDASGFSSTSGFRGGRIKERQSLREPLVAGRMDYRVLESTDPDFENELRVGFSGAYGGVDNANSGGTNNLNGEFTLLSADYNYRVGKVNLRGQVVQTHLTHAEEISAANGDSVARGMFGWYQEVAYHYLPANHEGGRLELSDANVFIRYEEVDTQDKMPNGVAANPAGTREYWVFGAQWWFSRSVVVKADYIIRNDKAAGDLDDLFNLGIGLVF